MDNKKKQISKIQTIIFLILMTLTLIILLNILLSKINGTQPRIFGYSFHVVLTDSMSPEIDAGDFIIAKKTDTAKINSGDYIIFVSPDPSLNGKKIVHKVQSVNNQEGIISFETTGIKQGAEPDAYPVYEIIGKYVMRSPFIGKVMMFVSKGENILFLAFIITMAFVAIKQIKNIINVKKAEEKD